MRSIFRVKVKALGQLTHRAVEVVSNIEMGQLRHQEPPIKTILTLSTPNSASGKGRMARIVTHLSSGLEMLYREKDRSIRPRYLKSLNGTLKK